MNKVPSIRVERIEDSAALINFQKSQTPTGTLIFHNDNSSGLPVQFQQ